MMVVLFFMFQFFQLYKESGNNYDTNEYADGTVLSGEGQWTAEASDAPEILFLGENRGELANMVEQWCLYTKHRLIFVESLERMQELFEAGRTEMLLIDGSVLRLPEQEEELAALAAPGTAMVFVRLPEAEIVEESPELKKLLGIAEVRALSAETEGIQVFPGFLLGGEAVYKTTEDMDEKQKKLQDMDLNMPWYQLGTGTKVYMTGLFDEDEVERSLFPPVIWRNSYQGTLVFAVNGNYMSGLTGLGFLDAFCYEWMDYYLYPVINAECVTVAGFPNFADENADKIMELYSRRPEAVQQDVMWPGLYALSEKNRRKLTFFFMSQYDYGDEVEPSGDNVVFFLKQLKEVGGEAGRTLEYKGNVTLADKLEQDRLFWEQYGGSYCFSAYYAGAELDSVERMALEDGSLADARTVVTDYQPGESLVSYFNRSVTIQRITGYADEYSYTRDLQRRSLETALGYYNLLMDLKPAIWPESREEQWENYFDDISSNIGTYWSPKDGFDSTTLTAGDSRVRNFLNLSYSQSRQEDTVTLKLEGAEEAWFLLRTHREAVKEIIGGECRELEEDVYLIHAAAPTVQLQLEGETGQTGFYFSE